MENKKFGKDDIGMIVGYLKYAIQYPSILKELNINNEGIFSIIQLGKIRNKLLENKCKYN